MLKIDIYDSFVKSLVLGPVACLCMSCTEMFSQKPTHKPAEFLYLDQLMEAWPHAAELHNVKNNNKINMCLIGNHGQQLTPVLVNLFNYRQTILLMFHSQLVVRHSNKC